MGDSQLPAPSSQLRILHVIPSISQAEGGPSYAVFAFARAARIAGAETVIVTTGDNGSQNRDGTCLCFARNLECYKISLSLRRWLDRHVHEFDLVHIHALFSFSSWAAARAAQKQNVPYVVRPLGVLNRWGLANRRRFLKQFWLRFIESPILKRAAAIHYTSEAEREEAAKVGQHVAELQSFIIPIPVSPPTSDARSQMSETFLQNYPKAKDKKVILFLARLDKKKGLDVLIGAFAEVKRERNDAILVIAGSGPGAFVAGLHRQAEQLGVADDIIWTGFLGGSQKMEAFSAATIYVLPSYSENFGIAAAEALALGVPTVLSDQVAIAREAAAADAAVAARSDGMEMAAALKQLLRDSGRREELGRNAKLFAERSYSMEQISAQLISEYRKILNLS